MKKVIGNIPEKLAIFCRGIEKATWSWEDEDEGAITTDVRPAYISDAKNIKTRETGSEWIKQKRWDYASKSYVSEEGSKIIEVDNLPFSNLRIINLEIRGQGGRAYKVCADLGGEANVYFDLREDILLDCIFEQGIQTGGVIKGPFVFARIGSQMKPIRVGSLLYKKLQEVAKKDKQKPCDLEIGGVYEDKKGGRFIYLGEFFTKSSKEAKSETVLVFHNSWRVKYEDQEANLGWFYRRNKAHPSDSPDGKLVAHNFHIVKKHSFKTKVGITELPDSVESYIEEVKKASHPQDQSLTPSFWNLSVKKDFIHPNSK